MFRKHKFLFLEIPDPFNPDQRILVFPKDKLKNYFEHIYWISKKSFDLQFFRVEIKSAFDRENDTKKTFRISIKNLFDAWQRKLLNLLYWDYFYLVLFTVFAYAIWNVGFIARGVDFLFTLGGDYLNPYAHVVLVLSPIVYVVYRKLLSGDTIFKKRKRITCLGEVKLWFEKPLWEEMRKKTLALLSGLDNASLRHKLRQLCLLLKKRNSEEIARWLLDIEREIENTTLSWFEKELLEELKGSLAFLLRNDFMFYETHWESSLPLLEWYASEVYKMWQEKLATLLKRLEKAPSDLLCKEIADLFLEMERKIRLKFFEHFPEEIFLALIDYYHHWYLFFQRLSYQEKALKKLFLKRWKEFLKNLDWEPRLGRVITLRSLVIVIFAVLVFCLHLVGEEDFLVVEKISPGFKSFLGREVTIVDQGIKVGKSKLLFSLPRPFAFSYRRTTKPQQVSALLILKEVEPVLGENFGERLKYWWEKMMSFFKQGYGTDFVVLEFKCSLQISEPELWKEYDFDGRGMDRLVRDLEVSLSSVYERIMGDLRMNLFAQSNAEDVEKHLQAVFQSPSFKEWIRRLLYPSPLDTYRVGSIYDMYLTGLEWLRRHPRMEKEAGWRDFVEHEMQVVRENLKREHTHLIVSPREVRDLIVHPSLEKLAEYPGLYQTLFYLAVNEIVNDRVAEELNLEKSDLRQKLEGEALNYLQDEEVFLKYIGVQVKSVKVNLGRVSYLRYMRLLQRRQNLV